MHLNYIRKRILIWGKTYPELSLKHFETVCTGGVIEEDGSPVRLYPIPRALLQEEKIKKYQWITAKIAKDPSDPRPESFKVEPNSIDLKDVVPTDDKEWLTRVQFMFKNQSWQFQSAEELFKKERENRTSIGVVVPREIRSISILDRGSEKASFEDKLKAIREKLAAEKAQQNLFDELVSATPVEMRNLDFVQKRIKIDWTCHGINCPGHSMQVLDWEFAELLRKAGEDAALEYVRKYSNLDAYNVKIFLGNLRLHPTAFTIVGFWYPKRSQNLGLFS